MGYFDDAVDLKKDMTQELSDMERFAGNAFWFSVGSMGMFLTTSALCSTFLITKNFDGSLSSVLAMLFGGIPAVLSIIFSFLGIVYGLKAQRSASMIRQKNPLKNMAIAYSLLWMLLSILFLSINLVTNIQTIMATL